MAIKLVINISNKVLYTIIALFVFGVLGLFVYAYNSDMLAGNPSVMGHSAGEINVNISGEVMSLQEAIDQGKFGFKFDASKCIDTVKMWGGVRDMYWAPCPNGYYLQGVTFLVEDDDIHAYRTLCCPLVK